MYGAPAVSWYKDSLKCCKIGMTKYAVNYRGMGVTPSPPKKIKKNLGCLH